MIGMERAATQVALAGIFCTAGCMTTAPPPARPAPMPPVQAIAPPEPPAIPAALDPRVEVPERTNIATVQPTSEPRYAPPESLNRFRFPQKAPAKTFKSAKAATAAEPAATISAAEPVEVATPTVVAVTAEGEAPRYKLPDSLKDWRPGRKVPLYDDPEAAPWQATPTEARLKNAAVSCNYKDEGGVRGKVTLLIDDFKISRFNARIEMPNGGVCQFDAKKMVQRPFEQGIALESTGDECIVRMWEQKHRITIAAYSCHKQCSKGSFSYLWPILMDTRIGTCY